MCCMSYLPWWLDLFSNSIFTCFFFKGGKWRGVTDEQWAKSFFFFLRKEIKEFLNEIFYPTKKGFVLHVIFK